MASEMVVKSRDYKICLLNVPFDDVYNNVLYFKDKTQQLEYFKNIYGLSFDNSPSVNFNFGDGLNCECVINEVAYTKSTYLNSIVMHNYCVIREHQIVTNEQYRGERYFYYFYFIKDCKYLTGQQVQFKLKLDVFQTYLLSNYVNILPKCYIKRAHLNRFSYNEDEDVITFNNSDISFLYTKEDLEFNKRLINYIPQKTFVSDSQELILREWFSKAIKYWIVIFVNTKFSSDDLFVTTVNLPTGQYKCILYPVMNFGYEWTATNNESKLNWILARATNKQGHQYSLNSILNLSDTLSAYIVDVRISKIPFNNLIIPNSSQMDYTIRNIDDGFGNTISQLKMRILTWTSDTANMIALYGLGYFQQGGCFYLEDSNISYNNRQIISGQETYTFEKCNISRYLGKRLENFDLTNISKEGIKQYSESPQYNPKMYSNAITDVKLKYCQNDFTYDLFALGDTNLSVKYYESLGPSIVRSYIYIDPIGLYNENTTKDFLGVVTANNFSLMYYTDQLASYIANNKNAWLQTTMKVVAGVTSGVSQGVSKSISTVSAVPTFTSGLTSVFKATNSILQYTLSMDNLKSAPASVSNIQGDVNLLDSITNLEVGIEIWQALDVDIDRFNDYCIKFGYKLNSLLYLSDYVNIRKYWNYIQADITYLRQDVYKFNFKIENEIKNAFSNGITLWNVYDTTSEVLFNYNMSNYENWLDEEE